MYIHHIYYTIHLTTSTHPTNPQYIRPKYTSTWYYIGITMVYYNITMVLLWYYYGITKTGFMYYRYLPGDPDKDDGACVTCNSEFAGSNWWIDCAAEDGKCVFTGSQLVRRSEV